jgi:hypothetical protein
MIIGRCIFYCPECRQEYARSIIPFQPGSGLRRCPQCTAVNRDASREWPELKKIGKFEFLFPTTVLGYMGAVIVTLIIVIPQMSDGAERNSTLGVVALLMLLPWVPYFLKRQRAIKGSVARFAQRTVLQEGVEIILPE